MKMNKYIEPTRKHEGEMVEVREFKTASWQQRKLLAVLPKPQNERFICELAEDDQTSKGWPEARIAVPKTYKELQAETGLKVGDWVRVLRSFSCGEGGFDKAFTWHKRMDKAIGNVYQIAYMQSNCISIYVDEASTSDSLPYFVLEKVDPPAQPDNELIHVPGTVEHWIYKGHAYRMATAGDVGKECIVQDVSVPFALERMCTKRLQHIEHNAKAPYRTGALGWKYALIQDDSLLKPALKEEYVPYTWEDRHQLRGKWYIWKSNKCETPVGKMSQDSKSGALLVDYIDAQCLFNNATHLDENGNDTGIPFGKKVVK